ncbi:polysaccharide lyase 6 family protein [Cognaticolwellia beringensis]|uniref:Alginate lyase n=1 Tax=Cognaticolwellia beringensis TaxID=1967665 RepID=A0A222G9X0_9GAMM|nr:polysaccharide lyase 6 family protein [Cognaticolwellia beringensis]ASP48657.1 alginate lyase [Cognaticolwellia beringensis]
MQQTKLSPYLLCCLTITLCLALTTKTLFAKEWLVDDQVAYKNALKKVKAGDNIVLSNGTWNDFEILFEGNGTKEKPITLKAQTKGKVILTGQSNLRLAGKHLIVSGLVFKDGFTPSSAVVAFRSNKDSLAYHSRVTEVVIDNFSNPDKRESDYWVAIYGQYNRLDHNYLSGKRNKGVTVAVRLNTKESQENHHKIDHNYFGPRPILGSNGGETLRIGTSHYSLSNSFTVVENNYFDRCDGEVEIISVKSGKNEIRNNVFFESRGTLTLRHGNGNIIEENVFLGNGVDHTGGIRVINKDQIIRNNYLEGLTGYRFGSGFTVMNGVPNSSINRYHQVENALVENNSFINVKHIQLAAGSDKERSAVPISSTIQNNLIFNEDGQQPFTLFDDVSGIKFKDNVANTVAIKSLASGINQQKIELKRAKNGLLYPINAKLAAKGAKKNLTPVLKSATGPNWYAKTEGLVAFESGKTIQVKAEDDALFNAVLAADNGDVLILADGEYNARKIIDINKTISIKAKNQGKAIVTFQRSTLFQISDGGSLTIDGLDINGSNSPDASGNTLVRSQKWGMVYNYRFVMRNSKVSALDINHSFHFFDAGNGSFADYIELTDNHFSNITGDFLRLNKEIEDLGIYNAEYVILKNNTFDNVQGALVNLYRGGTDESTFGPHLAMFDNTIKNSGKGKRNKSASSLYLHGVQVTNVESNTFNNTANIVIEHTVGEPITAVKNNLFKQTASPSVKELHALGPHTAVLSNNKQSN